MGKKGWMVVCYQQGEDWEIIGVFTSEELADEIVDGLRQTTSNDYDVEEIYIYDSKVEFEGD